jgi:PmbA protein
VVERTRIKEIIDTALKDSQADATEVLVFARDNHLTRFANSTIHQHVAETNLQIRVRAIAGRRQGVASTNDTQPGALRAVAEQALQAARIQPERETDIPLAEPARIEPVIAFSEKTAECSPRRRAEAVRTICRRSEEAGLVASGAFSTAIWSLAIGNSRGLFAYHAGTQSAFTTVVMGEDSSGFAENAHWDIDELDTDTLGREAIETALRSRSPLTIEAGEYPVILKPYAVCDIIGTLGWIGLGALSVQEQRSFMTDQFGNRVASPLVTIWDDGRDLRGLPAPFDFEGTPKQRVTLIEKGIARNVVYDLDAAAREGRQSTGHGLPAPNMWGAMPSHLFMAAGEASLEQLVASVDRGLLVTRFHYTVPVHEKRTVTTGMTRDGTFWIEGGEIAYPVKNLRFTQSYIGALDRVEMLGRDTRLTKEWSGGNLAPAVKVGAFRFTGGTEF